MLNTNKEIPHSFENISFQERTLRAHIVSSPTPKVHIVSKSYIKSENYVKEIYA